MFEIFFGVYADGVKLRGLDVDVDVVFKEAELFEAFGLLQRAGRQGGESLQGLFAVGVEADVLPVFGRGVVAGLSVVGAPVAVVGDGCAGEVEGSAVGGGDYFYSIGIGDVVWSAEDFEGGDLDVWPGEWLEESGDVLRLQ